MASPPRQSPTAPPPPIASPPPPADPPPSSPPPPVSSPPPPVPPASSPPPPVPPASSPPPPVPPASSPPPLVPPASSPPPPGPPASSPPPPVPPASSPPPPASSPPANPPPSPSQPANSPSPPVTPVRSPPPPDLPVKSPPLVPPASSPPPPELPVKSLPLVPPASSPPPPVLPTSSPPPPANSPPSPFQPANSQPSPPPPANSPPSPSPPANSPPPPANSPLPLPSPVPPGATNNAGIASISTRTNGASNRSVSSSGSGGIGTSGGIGIIAICLLLLCVVGAAIWCLWKRKKKGYKLPAFMDFASFKSETSLICGTNARIGSLFSYRELFAATNGFSCHNLLGEGGFGCVYEGHLKDGRVVAVKQLKIDDSQGEREFRAEVEIISRIHHRHLVSLVGSCISNRGRLLVYDYVSNRTLYYHLHDQGSPGLDWPTRIKIAIGSARGLAYLHEDCHPRVIHRDIKSANILIDENFEAQVCDFGLAKFCQDSNTHVTTRVMGTFGYLAPEYASSGKLTEKSDVFSFGVVLLELITGRKPVDTSQPVGQQSLAEWGRPRLNHAIETEQYEELVDPRLSFNFVESEMMQLIQVAAACIRHSSTNRPQMGQVVRAFDTLTTSDLTNGMKVGDSQDYNSGQKSEEIRWFRRVAFGSQNSNTDFFSQNTHSHSHCKHSSQNDTV